MKRLALLLLLLAAPAFAQSDRVRLTWTAPGDDGTIGTATLYEMRYSQTAPDTANTAAFMLWFSNAIAVPGLPAPSVAGTAESFVFTPGTPFAPGTYYFCLRARDDAGNVSSLSNIAPWQVGDVLPPSRVSSLRAQ